MEFCFSSAENMLEKAVILERISRVIDTHSHILAGMDDGPDSKEEALRMARIAVDDGIRVVVATPHSFDGRFTNRPEAIISRVAKLNRDLRDEDLPLTIAPGMEARVTSDLIQAVERGDLLSMNRREYILLKFHPAHVPAGFENLAFHFRKSGFKIVIAHPEKNAAIQRNPTYLLRLMERFEPWAILVQITAQSLTGDNGFTASRTARSLLKSGIASIIATDSHSSRFRPPRLSDAVKAASVVVGEERAAMMVRDIPSAVLLGKAFPPAWDLTEPRPWWRFL